MTKQKIFGKILVTLTIALTMSACVDTIQNFQFEDKPTKQVLNAVFHNDSVITVYLSESHPISKPFTEVKPITNAELILFENKQKVGTLTHEAKGIYKLENFTLKESSIYTIEAHTKGFADIEAQMTMPNEPQILSVTQNIRIESRSQGCIDCGTEEFLVLDIKMRKTPQVKNYFSVCANIINYNFRYTDWVCDTIFNENSGTYYLTNCAAVGVDTIGQSLNYIDFYFSGSQSDFYITDWGSYYLLCYFGETHNSKKAYFSTNTSATDEFIYTIKIPTYLLKNATSKEITLSFNAYHEAIYKHLHSQAKVEDIEDNFLAEKISIYTNVKNGLGVFSAVNNKQIKITHSIGSSK